VIRKNQADEASPYRWEPKKSFDAVATIYRQPTAPPRGI
jgi:hypothetical protein